MIGSSVRISLRADGGFGRHRLREERRAAVAHRAEIERLQDVQRL